MEKLFKICNPGGRAPVHGFEAVPRNHVALLLIAKVLSDKPLDDLELNERGTYEFHASGTKGVFTVHRVR